MSISPFSKAATRAAASGMIRSRISSKAGLIAPK
jgi:hypothetical protein